MKTISTNTYKLNNSYQNGMQMFKGNLNAKISFVSMDNINTPTQNGPKKSIKKIESEETANETNRTELEENIRKMNNTQVNRNTRSDDLETISGMDTALRESNQENETIKDIVVKVPEEVIVKDIQIDNSEKNVEIKNNNVKEKEKSAEVVRTNEKAVETIEVKNKQTEVVKVNENVEKNIRSKENSNNVSQENMNQNKVEIDEYKLVKAKETYDKVMKMVTKTQDKTENDLTDNIHKIQQEIDITNMDYDELSTFDLLI